MKPVLSFLAPAEIESIHSLSLDILEEMGMEVPLQEARDILAESGCQVKDGDIVCIPREIVQKALETVPKREDVTLFARDRAKDIQLGQDSPVLAAMVEATHVRDIHSGDRRKATDEDLRFLMTMLERLEHVSIASPPVTPQDVPQGTTDWFTWSTSIQNTSKHITGPGTGRKCVQDVIRMGSIALGGEDKFLERPFVSFWILTKPPLQVDHLTLEALIEASSHKIPLIVSSGPILGVTSPVTIAGTAAMAHAEILFCLVLSQLVKPGAPVIYTSFARSMDMRAGNVSMSSPEFAILKSCMAEMGRSLGLPTRMPAMLRDAKILDAQAGFETGVTGLVSALAADIMDGMQFDMDIVVDFADFVFCNECMAEFKRIARGVDVNKKTLAKDVISSLGHGGNYLGNIHTLQNFRKEVWQPQLFERRMWGPWEKDGAVDIREKARTKVLQMQNEKTPPLLAEELCREIHEIAQKAALK